MSSQYIESINAVYDGSEPFFSFFSQAQVSLATLRLSLEERVVVQTSDLASQMETARRTFQHLGKFPETIQEVLRINALFQQRFQSWEREVQVKERGKQAVSGAQLQRLKSEVSQVRMKARMTERTLSKLEIVLHQLEAEESEKEQESDPNVDSSDSDLQLVDEQVDDALTAIFGNGLHIDYALDENGTAADVEVIHESSVLNVVIRISSQDLPVRFELIIIPKFQEVSDRFTVYSTQRQLELVESGQVKKLPWDVLSGHQLIWPTSSKSNEAIRRTLAKRFSNGTRFQYLHLILRVHKNSSSQIRFRTP